VTRNPSSQRVVQASIVGLLLGLWPACTPPHAPEATSDAALDAGLDASFADADADAADADADDADAGDADAGDADAGSTGPRFAAQGRCPEGMASLGDKVCIDRWEGALVLVGQDGTETLFPHNQTPTDSDDVRAVSRPGVLPQTYVSAMQAEDACGAAGKRLCSHAEWIAACEGSKALAYPYGEKRSAGTCNDEGRSPIAVVFPGATTPQLHASTPSRGVPSAPTRAKGKPLPKGSKKGKPMRPGVPTRPGKKPRKGRGHSGPAPGVDPGVWSKLNDPRLGEVSGTYTKTGERALCKNELEVFDLVGNVHEWVADETASGNGIFAGGYFQDVQINGEGCHYRTTAHARSYHDYSTGFRCCRDLTSSGKD
jgi:sulfatase modifying factor 1